MPIPSFDTHQPVPPEDAPNAVPSSSGKEAIASQSSEAHTQPHEAVLFSEGQVEYENLQTMIHHLPEIRENKVQELREAIASGTYQVSSMDVANALLRDLIPHEPDASR